MNRELLKYCLRRIEKKLGWISNDLWQNQDFDLLSDRIFDETGVKLSVTTLKRVWGKVNYSSEPSISTLNALAKFIGYDNWSDLKNSEQFSAAPKPKSKPSINLRPVVILIALALTTVAIVSFSQRSKPIDLSQVKFGAEPVTLGLPNSVVFTYDFGDNEVEEATIQQSWNEKLTFSIDPNKEAATGIYYYPGYFKAKLLANNRILKEQDLHIRTDGWMATINHSDSPRYLYNHELSTNGRIRLTEGLLKEIHDEDSESVDLLTYHFFDDFESTASDDFVFETRFRNTYKKSNGICQRVQVLVHAKDGVFLTPFSIPGCTSDLYLITSGESHSGKENDLSSFGIEATQWNDFRLEVSKGMAHYLLNQELIFTQPYETNIGDIVGFKFRFEGAGELDYAKLSNNQKTIFFEDFN
ncbi:hypothetical protein [Roseivirga sp. E12]|uniref:hypothetical protein n=1 Tax=Roseivirga sp. E12 TaxID=2819237 RepID=UPI001ABCA3A5|nr:hypothetical protein [Roseivirga sp. E12]MBO3696851.1 hypothetical protein [Roseivirga sp. E12]